ncbi:MAG: orotate phosphoribosyltransferase [Spirochaetia bacterium]
MNTSHAIELAKAGLSIGSIRLRPEQPFRWASGYYMPIYNDNRLLLSSWKFRALVASAFEDIIHDKELQFDIIAGTATAGIPHATTLADRLHYPLVYVRGSSKGHGLQNRIEGIGSSEELSGRRVLLIEDLISTGGSSIDAVNALRQTGAQVDTCLAIFTYGLHKAAERFSSLQPACSCLPILEYDQLIDIARQNGYINEQDQKSLFEWRPAPFAWGEAHGFPPEGDK